MKKFWSLFLTLLIPTSVLALPVGNPWDASLLRNGVFWEGHCAELCDPNVSWCDAWSLRVGFYGDYVFDRHLKLDTNNTPSTMHRTEIYTNAVYLAFNMWDRIDLFSTLGTTNINLSTPIGAFGSNNDYFLLETDTDFSWSLGLRATIWECGCFGIGGEIQYFSTRPNINFIRDENSSPQYGHSGDIVKYREWQIGLGAAYEYYITSCSTSFVPYFGVKWSRVRMDSGEYHFEGDDFDIIDLENDWDWGYAVGLTLVGCDKMSVTIEGRFVDERAVHVNTQFRF